MLFSSVESLHLEGRVSALGFALLTALKADLTSVRAENEKTEPLLKERKKSELRHRIEESALSSSKFLLNSRCYMCGYCILPKSVDLNIYYSRFDDSSGLLSWLCVIRALLVKHHPWEPVSAHLEIILLHRSFRL